MTAGQVVEFVARRSGLRLLECLRQRVKDLDFAGHEITVREGKGNKDRRTMLPLAVEPDLPALWSVFSSCTNKICGGATARSSCPTRWSESCPKLPASGAGNMCSQRRRFLRTRVAAPVVGITPMRAPSPGPSHWPCAVQA
jgi:hypothetical protein